MAAKKSFQMIGMKRKGKKTPTENSVMLLNKLIGSLDIGFSIVSQHLPPQKTWKKAQRRATGPIKGMEQFLYKKQLMGQGSSVRRRNTQGRYEWRKQMWNNCLPPL